MVTFNEEKQEKKLKVLREQEEENLAQILSENYGISNNDISRISITTDALRLIPESKAREIGTAAFHKVGKKLPTVDITDGELTWVTTEEILKHDLIPTTRAVCTE